MLRTPRQGSDAVLRGDSLTYTDSLIAVQATSFVLPDEAGRAVMLSAESLRLRNRCDVIPDPTASDSLPRNRAVKLSLRMGDVDLASSHDAPVRTSPQRWIERLLIAEHGEGHAVSSMSERAGHDDPSLASREHRLRVTCEIWMTLP